MSERQIDRGSGGVRHDGAPPLLAAHDLLRSARGQELAGRLNEAAEEYQGTITSAEREGDEALLSEALRRLGVIHFRRHELTAGRDCCNRSLAVAQKIGNQILAAEALNSLGASELEIGAFDSARAIFERGIQLGGFRSPALRARIEQNLGIIANIQGELDRALMHYHRALEAFRDIADDRGCAIVYHNLGKVSADRQEWDEAERYFDRSLQFAESVGDVHLRASCLLSGTEVLLTRQRYDDARRNAEAALQIFGKLGIQRTKAEAYRVLGVVYRETGRTVLAEARFRSALELAAESSNTLAEAESARDLARLYQEQGRNQEALKLLNTAHRLFRRLDARIDLVDIATKRAELENVYLDTVREWGRSIESADTYTFGHCERVADFAVRVAEALELPSAELTVIRMGAYLHDLGKVKVPDEILNKPGRLTTEEMDVMRRHPLFGIEMLAGIDFPWDIKPIIRWHHEKYDGTGYPDRLCGDEIPLTAQIIGIADVYDALTSTRSYRPAMTHHRAVEEIRQVSSWWHPDVVDAFMTSIGSGDAG
ncbi:MAG: tetratricopeptide repeat protein [Gemmatimonadaceae bacterium]|nr:tetratricopeptide repeat protein [Gemmatimonadaceae bacterium]NUQ93272.1 tetratricopeptide repeat protein [Gemmatimonadaceae bacterium]NUR19752.1 tetratricopeptide repeat protein [Gemmatimonadaceae bacterium]NUS96344.1 tetratricopeptide repeat protein [Gemmatimonadaceae bacterium]